MNAIENVPSAQARDRLQSVRLRATAPRLQVMKALLSRPRDWFSAETLYRELFTQASAVSLGTLYRSMNDLAGRGLLLRLVDENGKRFFRMREDDHALHRIVCSETGRLLALTDDISPAHLACVLRGKGLMLAEARLTVQVTCVAEVEDTQSTFEDPDRIADDLPDADLAHRMRERALLNRPNTSPNNGRKNQKGLAQSLS
ncbi:Fur family transcriptional regulator [Bordetella sp. N]|uniref:Fur family transcriptional regulator n=1 Tax=Bordetella sp. N TaxID=1746199 RepID=UPI00070A42FF|nr:transcriptional repressor [Bordetella sp. N]ALM84381.1 hypothetical protein ASB57_16640 [Bordetella sp. N]